MSKQFQYVKPDKPFIVNNTGLQQIPDAFCEHGQVAIGLLMFGYRYKASIREEERFDAIVPRCVLAETIGTLTALIRTQEGEDALEAFMNEVAAAADRSAQEFANLRTQGRDCCEAGFRTHGREHTCSRNEAGQ